MGRLELLIPATGALVSEKKAAPGSKGENFRNQVVNFIGRTVLLVPATGALVSGKRAAPGS